MRKKRTATKTGNSFALVAAAAIVLCWPADLGAADRALTVPAPKDDLSRAREQAVLAQKDEKQATAPFALIAGTVYRPPGFALPGAEVSVTPAQPESNGIKLKKAKLTTDARGEWTLRVPPVPALGELTSK